MPGYKKHTETFVVDDFPGHFIGTSLTKLPPGAMVDEVSGTRAQNFQMTESGEIVTSGGYSRICLFNNGSAFAGSIGGTPHDRVVYSSALYHWAPPTGGDYILLFNGDKLRYLYFSGVFQPEMWAAGSALGTHFLSISNPWMFGMFEPFRKNCYYVDGVNPMLRISNDTEFGPIVDHAGIWHIPGLLSMGITLKVKKKRGMSSRFSDSSLLRYAFTVQSPEGESPAVFATIDAGASNFLDATAGESFLFGPSGKTPGFEFSWDGVLSYNNRIHAINIYRTPAGSNIFRWVGTVNRHEYSYYDTKLDGELGYPLQLDNALPSNFRLLCAHGDRMFAIGGYNNRNRVSCSKLGFPEIWPPQYELSLLDLRKGEDITQIFEVGAEMYVFLNSRILRLTGYIPEDFGLELVSSSVGCIAPRSMVRWEGGVVFLADSGVYSFNGTSLKRLSAPIFGLFEQESVGINSAASACGAIVNDIYYLSYSSSSNSVDSSLSTEYPNKVLSCNLRTGKWGTRTDGAFLLSTPYKGGSSVALVADKNNQGIFLMSEFSDSDIRHTGPSVRVGHTDLGYPNQVKVIESIEITYESLEETDVSIIAYAESTPSETAGTKSETVSTTATEDSSALHWGDVWSGDDTTLSHLQVFRSEHDYNNIQGKTFSFAVTFDSTSAPIRIQKFVVNFSVEKHGWAGKYV